MTLLFENESSETFSFDPLEQAKLVIDKTIEMEDFPFESQVSLTLVDEDTIKEINRENRDIDKVTDVLSFPMLNLSSPSDFSDIENDDGNFDYETGEALLGDIVICVQKVKAQAKDFGHGEIREFSFLIAHSMLHLFGYDHMSDEEEKVMFSRQEEILSALSITR